MLFITLMTQAQCKVPNTAFGDGEELQYKLYFNWQFVWISAGTASMVTHKTKYEGVPAYKTTLVTRTSKKLDSYFMMRDTLVAYCNEQCQPLYHRKGSYEGDRYYVDEVWYSYPREGTTRLRQHAITSKGEHRWKDGSYRECFCDMMSIFQKARNLSPEGWEKGHRERLPICDGEKAKVAYLRMNGRTTVKGEDGKKYKCLDLSYLEYDDNKWEEICRFYVTDNKNHIPIRIDLFLKFGTAKAYVTSMKGVKQ